ncbi:hypothetical protein OH799_29550 [Nocardia sp. NBC_00881]|uniref:hypothetical protein n=1 Tax=Nocardia sp. NBC_00881 TaxID=2975995 RepID=UPI003866A52B|nr:hypothetical protein OH799_29550 [Nocardia sp. NBC_00881]
MEVGLIICMLVVAAILVVLLEAARKGSEADRALRRQRIVWILTVLALFAAGIAAILAGSLAGFHRNRAIPNWAFIYTIPACWTAGTVLYVAFAPRLCRYRKRVWITFAAVLALATARLWWMASIEADEIRHLECADVTFPEGADLVWYESKGVFASTSVAVVDIPFGSVGEFKQRSGLAQFDPGVPWWKSYWDATGMTDLLSTDTGNEHSVIENRDIDQLRFVIIHDGGGETRRVFVHTNC